MRRDHRFYSRGRLSDRGPSDLRRPQAAYPVLERLGELLPSRLRRDIDVEDFQARATELRGFSGIKDAIMANPTHEANRRRWDAGSASWAHADTRGIWKRRHLDPSLALDAAELKWLRDVEGKSIAVLGSGDNQVVFALSGMGANVTSIDISERQLDIARSRAAALGLNVTFLAADVVDLSCFDHATFDLVYTGGHVAIWVSDLQRYYREAARILKPHGLLIVSEYHPFRRVWKRSPSNLELRFNYFDRGPHRSEAAPDVLSGEHGELEQFQFRWTVADYIAAILASGCQLVHAEEFGNAVDEWEVAPMAGLPASLLLVGRRAG
jgi:SAM-dependent methyltransferase